MPLGSALFQFMLFAFLLLLPSANAIGVMIPPIKNLSKDKKSSLKNLQNCVSYETTKKDIMFVTISNVEQFTSQSLNLLILDDQGNTLRNQQDIGKFNREVELLITNLESLKSIVLEEKREEGKANSNNNVEEIAKDTKMIHVCFDNVYSDLSWSFQPRIFEFEVTVNIKNDIESTDYGMYRQYFTYLQDENSKEGQAEINAMSFEAKMLLVEMDLQTVVDKLLELDETLKLLMENEFKLRDANEEIFSGYTLISIVLCVTILVCGLLQLIYFKFYLRRKNVLR